MQAKTDVECVPGVHSVDDFPGLNVVIVYDDVSAGQHAMHVLASQGHDLHDIDVRPRLWRFDFLEDPEWFALALADAINADMVVISTSAPNGLNPVVRNWIKLCLARKRGSGSAIVALFGPAGNLDELESPRYQFVQNTAREAGLDVFAPHSP